MSYRIFYHPRAKSFLKKIAKTDFEDLVAKLDLLGENPYHRSLDIKKISGQKDFYRLRYRKIRVVYQVDKEKRIVYVLEIDFRGNVY